jgi:hypothetical protein
MSRTLFDNLLQFSANIVVACASANLVILTWVSFSWCFVFSSYTVPIRWTIWSSHRPVRLLLAFVTLGHWFILAFGKHP